MVVNKRKKNSRQRGNWTHGWGAKKKRRGSGHRGGKGMGGSGKRADSKKPSVWKDEKYFGKYGFKKKGQKKCIMPINIEEIEEKLEEYVNSKLAVQEGDTYNIDLSKIGYNKLLGRGKVKHKLKIKVFSASKRVIEKVKKFEGNVVLINKVEESIENK